MARDIEVIGLDGKTVKTIPGTIYLSKEAEQKDKEAQKRRENIETKRDTGETTNPMGDKYAKGGKVSSASKRADGCAIRGKTRA